MNNQLFREAAIKKVSSPEALNDYMKVTTPRVWIILIAVALLLIGAIIWGIFGSVTIVDAYGNLHTVNPIYFIVN